MRILILGFFPRNSLFLELLILFRCKEYLFLFLYKQNNLNKHLYETVARLFATVQDNRCCRFFFNILNINFIKIIIVI